MYTPTPWTIGPTSNPHNGTDWRDLLAKNYNGDDMYIGEALKHDAAFIVRAVNAHEAMRKALETILEGTMMAGMTEWSHADVIQEHYKIARRALALADGKEQP